MKELIQKIIALENKAMDLEPDDILRKQFSSQVLNYGEDFLRRLGTDLSYDNADNSLILENIKIGDKGKPLAELIDIFTKAVEKPGISTAGGGHLGYIPGGGLYPSALADYLAALTNKYAGIYFGSPGAARMEKVMVDWLKEILGFPEEASGNLSSGGSIATLTAVAAARDAHGIHGGAVEKAVIYSTTQAHHCLHKAIRIAGLGTAIHREIPTDQHHKMPLQLLEEKILQDRSNGLHPFLIVSSAGTTDTGVVDPLDGIAELAQKYHLWHHVDAAYGGFFILVDSLKPIFKGIEKADSITIDPHKGLFLPYGTGAVLIRDIRPVLKSHYYLANYMRDAYSGEEILSPADLSPELTKHFRGLRMWMPLHLFGLNPFRAALEEKHLLAVYFEEKIKEMGFETGGKPELSVVTYRYKQGLSEEEADRFNQQLIKTIHHDGRIFLSSTTIGGRTWLRCAVLSFRSHLSTIEKTLEMIGEIMNGSTPPIH